jgi:hypothetical protein
VIEVRVSIPLGEYFRVKDDLEDSFNKHGLIVVLSADTVIRTWAGLMYHDWFDKQECFVDHFIGYGEVEVEWQEEPMIAAVSADMVDEGYQPRVVMMFEDEANDFAEITEETARNGRDLALLFKLTHGGM